MKIGWFTYSCAALFSFATMIILITIVMRRGTNIGLVMTVLGIIPVSYFAIMAYQNLKMGGTISKGSVAILIVASILSIIGNIGQFEAAKIAPNAGLPFAVISFQSTLIAIASLVIFKDTLTLLQIAGMFMGLGSVLLLSLGK